MSDYVHTLFELEIPKREGFESFCFQNCQRILLIALGFKDPELYINSAISVEYDRKKKELHTGSDLRSLLPSLMKYTFRKTYPIDIDPEQVFEENVSYIREQQSPIIVGADTFYLPYASNYQKNHAKHTIVMCGFDNLTKEIPILDWYPPWFYKGQACYSDFILSRNSKNESDGTIYSGKPIENNWSVIERFDERKPEELLSELFLETDRNFFSSGKDDNILVGHRAFEVFMEDTLENPNEGNLKKNYRNVQFIARRFTLFRQCLETAGVVCPKLSLNELCENITRMGGELDKTSMVLLKGSMRMTDSFYERLRNRIEMLFMEEEQLEINFSKTKKELGV